MVVRAFLCALFLCLAAFAGDWQAIDDHPRPNWARPWINLNGEWKFDFDPQDVGLKEEWHKQHEYGKKINVPFPWQSKLSGIEDTKYNGVAWYERDVTIPSDAGPRILLTFGAVDWAATVWVNGKQVAEHEGGYVPFSADITDAAGPGETARITVRAVDRTEADLPTGKQIGWYTQTGGIWQTVYLESRPESAVLPSHIYPDIDKGEAIFKVPLSIAKDGPYRVTVKAKHAENELSTSQTTQFSTGDNAITLTLPIPNAALWSPDEPNLYDATIELSKDDKTIDSVNTYFGMRKVSRGTYMGSEHEYILLNNKPIYLRGALHQSFNPDGIYTHPDDTYIKRDYEKAKALGLNMLRIHIKVEEPRALYWADKLGVMLMTDTPNWWKKSERSRAAWENTMTAQIARDFNHPSIIAWVLFNETWGIGDQGYDRSTQEWVRDMYLKAKELDPTRLVEDNSPCNYDHVVSDINSWHFYIDDFARARDHIQEVIDKTQPGSQFNYAEGWKQDTAPLINSEYGGVSAGSGDRDISWVFLFLTNLLRKQEKCVGYVYTELSDIEWEHNGFMNYDRSDKMFNYPANITVANLQSADFPVLDCPPYQVVKAGETVTIPVSMSHWSELSGLTLKLSADGQTVDNKKWSQWVQPQERAIDCAPYRVTPQAPFTFTAPRGEGLLNVVAEVLYEGKRIGANYCVVHVQGGAVWDTQNQVALTFPVESYANASPSETAPMIFARNGKVYRHGAGFIEYKLQLPKDLKPESIKGAKLYVEIGGKANEERLDWPSRKNPQDYPQSDSKLWPTTITVTIDGKQLGVINYPMDTADARGVLSHVASYQHGSYGGAYDLPLREETLPIFVEAAKTGKPITLRFEVTEDAKYKGGLALYGKSMGAWPSDPLFLVELADGAAKPSQNIEPLNAVTERLVTVLQTGPNGHTWRFITDDPGPDWKTADFKDTAWKKGKSGFGTKGTPGERLGTEWNTPDIWLRTEIEAPKNFGAQGAWIELHHDEDVQIYVNGNLLLERKNHITDYQRIALSSGQITLFEPGKKNLIAVHCHQSGGGQYVDLGISSLGK